MTEPEPYQQWGVLTGEETEPHRIFNTREQADLITAWRNEHGIPSHTVCRWITEWVTEWRQAPE